MGRTVGDTIGDAIGDTEAATGGGETGWIGDCEAEVVVDGGAAFLFPFVAFCIGTGGLTPGGGGPPLIENGLFPTDDAAVGDVDIGLEVVLVIGLKRQTDTDTDTDTAQCKLMRRRVRGVEELCKIAHKSY